MKAKNSFHVLLKQRGFSEHAIDKLWKWYDYYDKKGVASY